MNNFKTMLRGLALIAALGAVACEDFKPVFVDDLILSADSVHISPGQTAVFTATPLSANGIELADRVNRVQWQFPNQNVAAVDTAGGQLTVTGLQLGITSFTARLGRGSAQGRVYVQPAGLVRIEVRADGVPVTQITGQLGTRPRFTAHLYDAAGNEMSPTGFRISWSTSNSALVFVGQPVGTISDMFFRRLGTTSIRLIVGGMGLSIPVTITP